MSESHAPKPSSQPKPNLAERIEAQLSQMSTEDKVGQLLLVGFGGTDVTTEAKRWVRERGVGGVIFFSRNIVSTEQVALFARSLQRLAIQRGVPIFIGLDQEGGNVLRLKKGVMTPPGNMVLGAGGSSVMAYAAGHALGTDLRRVGVNMNLAPVLDVNSNPRNPVIGVRSYGEEPSLVAHLGSWFLKGQQQAGIASVAKHFPGHGDTQSDSHFEMPAISADLDRLSQVELLPFKQAMDAGLDAVMTAHIAVPSVTGAPDLPATVSDVLLNEVLRKKLGFDGIVLTDGLEMQGIVKKYGSGRAAVMAILAGADMPMILWTAERKEEVYRALLEAVQKGVISGPRLDASVRRILRVKIRRGLFDRPIVDPTTEWGADWAQANPVHENIARSIAEHGVTVIRNHGQILPIPAERYERVVVMSPKGPIYDAFAGQSSTHMQSVPYVPNRSRRKAIVAQLTQSLLGADAFVATVVNRYHIQIVQQVMKARPEVPVIILGLGSPFVLQSLPDVAGYICAYSYISHAQSVVAQVALGTRPAKGSLPVSIPGRYDYGHRE